MEKLLKRLPKKYHTRVLNFYEENGLIDNCKYIVEFKEPYKWHGDYSTLPCKSINEAINFIKELN